MTALRVLHVIPSVSFTQGGPSFAIRAMERALVARGVDVTTLTTDDDGPGRRRDHPPDEAGARRVYFRKRLDFYKAAPGIVPWLLSHVAEFDVVHIHALFSFTSNAAALVARLRNVPYVVRPLGTLTAYGVQRRRPALKKLSLALLDGPAVRNAAAVHFTSDAECAEARALRIPMNPFVAPLAVESLPTVPPGTASAIFPALGPGPYLLFLSRLDPKKNLESLLHAFADLRAGGTDCKLLVAGDGTADYVATLHRRAQDLGISDHVVWAGHVDGTTKAAVLQDASLFVLPSHSENFGIAVAEALLAGLPCVVGRGVAVASDVTRHHAGLAVEPAPAPLAAAIRRILTDDALHASMCRNAQALARREYSAQAMGERLVQLYDQVRQPAATVSP